MKRPVDREGNGGKLEAGISLTLILGVVLSLVLEVAGIVVYYQANGNVAILHGAEAFIHDEDFLVFLLRALFENSSATLSMRLMTLGIAVLILTPYARVVMSVAYFAAVKNIKYFLITLFVLVLLTVSLSAH